LSNRAA
jgi:hypothetical protein